MGRVKQVAIVMGKAALVLLAWAEMVLFWTL